MTDRARFGPGLSDPQKAAILDDIARTLPVLINVRDEQTGRFVYVSAGWEGLTGLPVERWLEDPMRFVEMIHPEDRQAAMDLAADEHSGTKTSPDTRILHQDGTIHWIHGWTASVGTPEASRVVALATDVTARKQLEEQLRAKNLELELALHARSVEAERLRSELQAARADWQHSEKAWQSGRTRYERLTPREQEVLQLLVQGRSNKLVADELGITLSTAKSHRGRVMSKMEVGSSAELAIVVARAGLIADAPPSEL